MNGTSRLARLAAYMRVSARLSAVVSVSASSGSQAEP
jgi:hypothetical protein